MGGSNRARGVSILITRELSTGWGLGGCSREMPIMLGTPDSIEGSRSERGHLLCRQGEMNGYRR